MNISTPLCDGFTSVQEDIIPILRSLKSNEANFIVYEAEKKDKCLSRIEEEGFSCHSCIIVRGTYFSVYLQKIISGCAKCPIWTCRFILGPFFCGNWDKNVPVSERKRNSIDSWVFPYLVHFSCGDTAKRGFIQQ